MEIEKIHGIGWGMGQFILPCHSPVDELGGSITTAVDINDYFTD